jgi:hypothetical protein
MNRNPEEPEKLDLPPGGSTSRPISDNQINGKDLTSLRSIAVNTGYASPCELFVNSKVGQ